MRVHGKTGKVALAIITIIFIIGALAYFGLISPSKIIGSTSAEEKEVIQIFEQINLEMGRYLVYLQENKFDEAKSSVLNIKLKLSDAKINLNSITSKDRDDLKELIDVYEPLMDGLNSHTDVLRLYRQKDILTWDKYNQMIEKSLHTRNKFADFYNKANRMQNEDIRNKMNLSSYKAIIQDMDDELRELQSEDMIQVVKANTFISKIDPTNDKVREVAASIEKKYGTDFDERLIGIIIYFSENLNYVHTPNWNPDSSIQHIQDPNSTLNQKGGNCADLSILFSSLAESIGVSTMFCFADTTHSLQQIQENSELFKPDHAVIQYLDENNKWLTLDITCYAGTDLETGDDCNSRIDYVVKCYEVQEFRELMKVN